MRPLIGWLPVTCRGSRLPRSAKRERQLRDGSIFTRCVFIVIEIMSFKDAERERERSSKAVALSFLATRCHPNKACKIKHLNKAFPHSQFQLQSLYVNSYAVVESNKVHLFKYCAYNVYNLEVLVFYNSCYFTLLLHYIS